MSRLTDKAQKTDIHQDGGRRLAPGNHRFIALCGTYFLSVFANNFLKQSALLLALSAGLAQLQGIATILINLPFLLFAAPAGFFADKFSKRSVIITAKIIELVAMVLAAIGILTMNWTLIMLVLAIEGTQAAIFSPSINGTIPEMFPAEKVTRANAFVRMVSTGGILAGVAVAGFALDLPGKFAGLPRNLITVSGTVIGLIALAVMVSFYLPRFRPAAPGLRFPLTGPVSTIKSLWILRQDKLLATCIAGQAAFYFLGSLNILVINQMGVLQFELSKSLTSVLILVQLMGIVGGGFLAAKIAKGPNWHKVLVPAALALALCMLGSAASPYVYSVAHLSHNATAVYLLGFLALMGIGGGLFMVPVDAFIQVRPAADKKGQTIAAANFTCFTGVLLSGPAINLFNFLQIEPTNMFASMGTMILAAIVPFSLMLKRAKFEEESQKQ